MIPALARRAPRGAVQSIYDEGARVVRPSEVVAAG
jgi:hypothetical protein